ncbi:hypothetical protein CBL_04548 [Carabus blaptoides fortunei]
MVVYKVSLYTVVESIFRLSIRTEVSVVVAWATRSQSGQGFGQTETDTPRAKKTDIFLFIILPLSGNVRPVPSAFVQYGYATYYYHHGHEAYSGRTVDSDCEGDDEIWGTWLDLKRHNYSTDRKHTATGRPLIQYHSHFTMRPESDLFVCKYGNRSQPHHVTFTSEWQQWRYLVSGWIAAPPGQDRRNRGERQVTESNIG